MQQLFKGIYKDKVILLTGHTGFKGSWLALWLHQLGAKVIGLSKDIPTHPSHWVSLNLPIISLMGDIRSLKTIEDTIKEYQPDIVFHLAAQAIVRYSYDNDIETFETNVMGTSHILHLATKYSCIKAVINITSDKAYDNKEWIYGYRETDAMGGYDPYSASKGCAELVANSYRKSYFHKASKILASARAGNVIGGGDWATDRLVPDIFKSVQNNEPVELRNPKAVRPWQHVLEPLSGYLLLGQHALESNTIVSDAWNFGPNDESTKTVQSLVEAIKENWNKVDFKILNLTNQLHEATLLKLDCSKAEHYLKWKPVWEFHQTLFYTTNWYKDCIENPSLNMAERSKKDLDIYIQDAQQKNIIWTQ